MSGTALTELESWDLFILNSFYSYFKTSIDNVSGAKCMINNTESLGYVPGQQQREAIKKRRTNNHIYGLARVVFLINPIRAASCLAWSACSLRDRAKRTNKEIPAKRTLHAMNSQKSARS